MQPVLGLVPHRRARPIDHASGDLHPPVCRQAVHHDDVGGSEVHEFLVELEATEDELPFVRLVLLPHAGPHIGVQDVGAGRGLHRIVEHLDGSAGLRRDLDLPLHDLRDRTEAGRRGDPHMHAHLRAREEQRVRDVVAVADVRQHVASRPAQALPHGEEVRDRLARVFEVRQRVDHRHRRGRRQLFQPLLLERPEDDRVDVAAEDAASVLDRLSSAELQVRGGDDERVRAELGHPDLERDPGPRRGFLEHQRDRSPLQPLAVGSRIGLQLPREIEDAEQLVRSEVVDGEVVAGHRRGVYTGSPTSAPGSAAPELAAQLVADARPDPLDRSVGLLSLERAIGVAQVDREGEALLVVRERRTDVDVEEAG